MKHTRRINKLKKLLEKNLTFPYLEIEKHEGWERHTTFKDKKAIESEILDLENAEKGIYDCFFCNKYSKEGIGGRFMPMDKRESGDNGFGNTYACYKCIPKEYGRL